MRFLPYVRRSLRTAEESLTRAALRPQWSSAAATVRLCMAIAVLLVVSGWFGRLDAWAGQDGPLDAETASLLAGNEWDSPNAHFRLSPLYWSIDLLWSNVYLLVCAVAALIMMSGWGARLSVLIGWLLLLGLMHRIAPVQGLGEVLLSTTLPYLLIDSGWVRAPSRVGFADSQRRWTVGLTLFMMRWHLVIWLTVSLLHHAAQSIWWDGTAVWLLASQGHSPLLGGNMLAGTSWPSAILGNLWLGLSLIFPITLAIRRMTPLAVAVSLPYWFGVWALSGDANYAIAGLAVGSCLYFEASLQVKSAAAGAGKAVASAGSAG